MNSLEKLYGERKAFYAERFGADSWQWRDEGRVYAVGDYLSSYELTDADRAFAEKEGIADIVKEFTEVH